MLVLWFSACGLLPKILLPQSGASMVACRWAIFRISSGMRLWLPRTEAVQRATEAGWLIDQEERLPPLGGSSRAGRDERHRAHAREWRLAISKSLFSFYSSLGQLSLDQLVQQAFSDFLGIVP